MDRRGLRLHHVHDLGGPTWIAAGDLVLVTPKAPPLPTITAALRALRLDERPSAPHPGDRAGRSV